MYKQRYIFYNTQHHTRAHGSTCRKNFIFSYSPVVEENKLSDLSLIEENQKTIVNNCKLICKVYYNREVKYEKEFDQQNIGKADVTVLIMKQVILNAENARRKS